jgi:hypothetical protein
VEAGLAGCHNEDERNLLIVLPWFILILVMGTEKFAFSWARIIAPVLLITLAVFAVWNLEVVKTERWTVYKPNPDWISASRYFGDEMEKRGALLVIATSPSNELPFYARKLVIRTTISGIKPGISLANFCTGGAMNTLKTIAGRRSSSFYLVHNTTFDACFDAAREAFAHQRRLKIADRHSLIGRFLKSPGE